MSRLGYCVNLGRVEYLAALDLQHRVVAARQAGRVPDVLLLVEHDPVITLGRRGDPANILAPAEVLAQLGIAVHRVERGGDVTYHGPGQLVGYPIVSLSEHGLGAADFMHRLEDVLMAALGDLGLEAGRRPGIIGVWLGQDKVAALGVRIERGVTYHGFALNVSTNLEHFRLIVPCGIRDGGVTSIERALGRPVEWAEVARAVRRHFAQGFGMELRELTPAELEGGLA